MAGRKGRWVLRNNRVRRVTAGGICNVAKWLVTFSRSEEAKPNDADLLSRDGVAARPLEPRDFPSFVGASSDPASSLHPSILTHSLALL